MRHNVTKVCSQSRTIERRLRDWTSALRTDVLYPPPPPRAYRCDGYGHYIFAVSRLTPLKRVDLLLRALAEPAARHVRAVIAGDGEERRRARSAGSYARRLWPHHLHGPHLRRALVDHLGRCRAVCFTPFDEDYGFVTVEAFASGKPVITCRDSGGPTELVRDGETGLVCEPTPGAVAIALARLMDDPAGAERMAAAQLPHSGGDVLGRRGQALDHLVERTPRAKHTWNIEGWVAPMSK